MLDAVCVNFQAVTKFLCKPQAAETKVEHICWRYLRLSKFMSHLTENNDEKSNY